MLKLNETQAGLLRSAHVYVDNNGVAFNGHHMIHLVALLDDDRQKMHRLIEALSDDLDTGDADGMRARLAEYFSES